MPHRIGIIARTCSAFLTFAFLSATSLTAQWNWEPVNHGLPGVHIKSIVHGRDGRMVLGTADGIYQYDEDHIEIDNSPWHRTDSTIRSAELSRSRDGTLSARTEYGIFVSYDDGLIWQKILDNPATPFVVLRDSTFAWCSGDRFYIAVGDTRFAREEHLGGEASLIACGADGTIYVVVDGAFILASTNSGRLWNQIAQNVTWEAGFPTIQQFEVIGSNTLVVNLVYATYHSSDRGKNWTLVHQNLSGIYQGDDGILYGFGPRSPDALPHESIGLLYRSSNDGLTWQEYGSYQENQSMINLDGLYYRGSFAANREGVLYQELYGQLHHSFDSGDTWNPRTDYITNIRARDLAYDRRSHSVYAVVAREAVVPVLFSDSRVEEYRSLYRLDEEGAIWIPVRDTISHILGIDSIGNLYVQIDKYVRRTDGTYEVVSNISLSHDHGDTWIDFDPITNGLTPRFSMHSSTKGVILLEAYHRRPGPGSTVEMDFTHYISIDSGGTWRRTEQWLPDTVKKTVVFHVLENGGILFAGASTDAASVPNEFGLWRYDPFTDDVVLLDTGHIEILTPAPDGTLFSKLNRRLQHSTDRGDTWTPVPMPFPSIAIEDLKIGRGNEIYLRGYTTTADRDSVYRSSDMGTTWTMLPHSQPELADHYPQIPAFLGGDLLVDSIRKWPEEPGINPIDQRFNRFGWSTDRGMTWMLDEGELVDKSVTAILLVDGRDLFVGTREDGIYRINRFLSVNETWERESIDIPLSVTPTPLINHGTIRFELEERAYLRLELFDALGRVMILLNDRHMEAGRHTLPFDIRMLVPGSYFLRLTTDTAIETINVLVQ